MTVFGDLETSTLRELPAGRAPITTHVVPEDRPGWMARTWARVAEEVRGGAAGLRRVPAHRRRRRAPTTRPTCAPRRSADDGDEDAPAAPPGRSRACTPCTPALAEEPALAGLSVEVLHGRLTSDEKDAVMARFQRGELDVLVSTTVVEVGVDVPNASVMVVMDADRFGVSQLHQLRGRIGRGGHPGLCLLVTGTDAEAAMTRLNAVAATTDGFELARLDLSQRREGDILGAAQHGRRTQLEFLHILEDEDVIEQAREDAFASSPTTPSSPSTPTSPRRCAPGSTPSRPPTWSAADDPDHRRGRRRPHAAHPAGSGTRPTSDRVREAVFSALDARDAVRGRAGARPLRRLGRPRARGGEPWRRIRRARGVRPSGGRRHRRQRARPRPDRHPRRAWHRRGAPGPRPARRRGRRPGVRRPAVRRSTRPRWPPCSSDCGPAGWPPGASSSSSAPPAAPNPPGPTASSARRNPGSTARRRSGTPPATDPPDSSPIE